MAQRTNTMSIIWGECQWPDRCDVLHDDNNLCLIHTTPSPLCKSAPSNTITIETEEA